MNIFRTICPHLPLLLASLLLPAHSLARAEQWTAPTPRS